MDVHNSRFCFVVQEEGFQFSQRPPDEVKDDAVTTLQKSETILEGGELPGYQSILGLDSAKLYKFEEKSAMSNFSISSIMIKKHMVIYET